MLGTNTDHSFCKTYLNCPFDGFLASLLGQCTRWRSSEHSHTHQHTVSVHIVSQIPQPHLGSYPHQTYGAHDQLPRSLRLHPKDMFHSTPDSGTRSITPELSLRQLLMPVPLPLKMLPIVSLLQLPEFPLRTVRRIRPDVSTMLSSSKRSSKT